MRTALYIYLSAINLAAFAAFGIDKGRAKRGAWRIPEARLMLFALFGGSVGALFGMVLFRHKTKKPLFVLGVPAALLLEGGVLLFLFIKGII